MSEPTGTNWPSWRHCVDGTSQLVADPDAEAKLGPGWYESPATAAEAAATAPHEAVIPTLEEYVAAGYSADGYRRRFFPDETEPEVVVDTPAISPTVDAPAVLEPSPTIAPDPAEPLLVDVPEVSAQ